MRGCMTSATTNRHAKSRHRSKLRLKGSNPYVWVRVLFAAQRS
jgi:hypothetical protein